MDVYKYICFAKLHISDGAYLVETLLLKYPYCNEQTDVFIVDWGLLDIRFCGYVTISAFTTFWWCSCSAFVNL